MSVINGVACADGIALAPALVLERQHIAHNRNCISADQYEAELAALQRAILKTAEQIARMQQEAYAEGRTEQGDVFGAYCEMVQDEELFTDVKNCIMTKSVDLVTALGDVSNDYAADMAALDDPYLQARADDFRQLFRMVLDAHIGAPAVPVSPGENFILVADEIGPADMAQVDKAFLCGIVTETGGRSSHAAIICRSMGIPMLSGVSYRVHRITTGTCLLLDADSGELVVAPSAARRQEYAVRIAAERAQREATARFLHLPAFTADGTPITVNANIGTVEELDAVLKNNADGIGLFRTEFLFMEAGGNEIPSEEKQYTAYKTVLETMHGKPVTFRTLDAGGDKNIAALGIPKEENPFLGWRAIRYCLKTPEIFRVQLRALIRASVYGTARIMVPMISCEAEVIHTKRLIDSVYDEFTERGETPPPRVPFGIMIETPAAALIADTLSQHVDFFSIGTNDLTQYTLAVDRGNEYVSDLYDELHPAVMELIRRTIAAAERAHIAVCMCGEMAGDIRCTQSLLDAGIRDFSMGVSRIPMIKKRLSELHCG
ncbi:MAG: phosphoenolpyruvate--protein phosphotransferase [Treponema sp.]|nr:phosphoenolpyruvate--protein phosphotransferase [Treponema sp.]